MFYCRLFTEEEFCRPTTAVDLLTHLSLEERGAISQPFSKEEVHEVVFSLAGDRVLGPDGFPLAFFKKCWEVIKADLLAAIREFQERRAYLGGYQQNSFGANPQEGECSRISGF